MKSFLKKLLGLDSGANKVPSGGIEKVEIHDPPDASSGYEEILLDPNASLWERSRMLEGVKDKELLRKVIETAGPLELRAKAGMMLAEPHPLIESDLLRQAKDAFLSLVEDTVEYEDDISLPGKTIEKQSGGISDLWQWMESYVFRSNVELTCHFIHQVALKRYSYKKDEGDKVGLTDWLSFESSPHDPQQHRYYTVTAKELFILRVGSNEFSWVVHETQSTVST